MGKTAGVFRVPIPLARRRTLRKKWSDYAWYRDTQRFHFDGRHPRLRWFPYAILLSFVTVTGIALVFNFANPLEGISGYLLSLVLVDFGMAFVAVLAWILGRRLWAEDRDARYLAAAIGFAGLPVWGVLQTLCITFVIPELSLSEVCALAPDFSWLAALWLMAVPGTAILLDFRKHLRGDIEGA
ncbi:MAG TPA: hypothetical protein VIB49_10680 [Thermoplasmata archaeon]|jgi:hypothetical protein